MVTNLFNITDTIISSKKPNQDYGAWPLAQVRNASGDAIYSLVLPPMIPPFPGAVISSYVLRYFVHTTFASTTFNIRQPTAKWSSKTTWASRPAVSGIVQEVTGAGTQFQPFDFDITALAQGWQAGSPNYGIRIETTSTAAAGRNFYSANAGGALLKYRPVAMIQWAAPPPEVGGFVATGGRRVSVSQPTLPWVYSDAAGSPMVAYQFQSNSTNSWTSPSVDTGTVASNVPQHKLTSTLADGQDIWYRVRHQNEAGLWSPWSAGQQTGRTAKPTLTINSPGATVTDFTPTYTWALSAGTQIGFRALTLRGSNGAILDDSKDRAGADNQYAPASALKAQINESVSLTLRVRDAVDRVDTPGDPSYIEASKSFTIQTSSGVTAVSSLAVAKDSVLPCPRLTWERSTAPDGYVVQRRLAAMDGAPAGQWRPIDVAPGAVALTATTNAWVDVTAPPHRNLEYRVNPVVNGETGDSLTVAVAAINPGYIWLLDPDDPSWFLPAAGQDAGTLEMAEDSAVVEVRGSDRAHLVHEAFRGYEGSVSGMFVSGLPNVGGLTALQLRDRAWRLKAEPVKLWRLVIGDLNIPVYVYNANPVPRPGHELTFGVSFAFLQQGELWWAA